MIKSFFAGLFKVLLALLLVCGALAALWYWADKRGGYIEIFNNTDDEGEWDA